MKNRNFFAAIPFVVSLGSCQKSESKKSNTEPVDTSAPEKNLEQSPVQENIVQPPIDEKLNKEAIAAFVSTLKVGAKLSEFEEPFLTECMKELGPNGSYCSIYDFAKGYSYAFHFCGTDERKLSAIWEGEHKKGFLFFCLHVCPSAEIKKEILCVNPDIANTPSTGDDVPPNDSLDKALDALKYPNQISIFGKGKVGNSYTEYLGCWDCNKYVSESVHNRYGEYGSKYSDKSIRNKYSDWGSLFRSKSACSQSASEPPVLKNDNDEIIGVLTLNKNISASVCATTSKSKIDCSILKIYCEENEL